MVSLLIDPSFYDDVGSLSLIQIRLRICVLDKIIYI